MNDDRNWSGELIDCLSYVMVYAPDFPVGEFHSGQETLESEFGRMRELLTGLRSKVGHQEWMDRFGIETERSYVIFREQGRCRAAVEHLQNAEDIMREAFKKRRGRRSQKQNEDD